MFHQVRSYFSITFAISIAAFTSVAVGFDARNVKGEPASREPIKTLQTASKIQPQSTILYVGVRVLPKQLSPGRAVLDSELQALELLFESLLQTRPGQDGALVYVPQLAVALPRMVDSERIFRLRKTAHWSNGAPVAAADLQKTFELLTSPKLVGRNTELDYQLESLSAGNDPSRVQAKLRQGLLDSLAPFTFKVLPREFAGGPLASADDAAFAQKPVGSGIYMLADTLAEHGRNYVRFVVNPHHAGHGDPAKPRIREIRFFVSTDPVADMNHVLAPAHLLLDVPTPKLAKLKAAGASQIRTLPTRRIWFLAVNCEDKHLADQNLRRALARGIDRKQLLADNFGGSSPEWHPSGIAAFGAPSSFLTASVRHQGATMHHILNGPFPAGSWACAPEAHVPTNLFDRTTALALLKKTGKSDPLDLELKYPDDDQRVQQACQAIADQWAALGESAGRAIKVRLIPLSAHQLQTDLQSRQYQLAYWRHDFPNDLYSLWPLLDPRPEATATGSNYLGYKDDGTLGELLYKAGSYRDFHKVKELTHAIHVALDEGMPLIPLWQLDYHLAVSPRLKMPPRIDPLRVFANIEEWQILGK